MSDHTPGPWFSEYDDNGFHYIRADGMPSPYIAATGGEGETNEANAGLIAAAPEMLEALKQYEALCCEGWCKEGPAHANFADCGGCLARLAIAKASPHSRLPMTLQNAKA